MQRVGSLVQHDALAAGEAHAKHPREKRTYLGTDGVLQVLTGVNRALHEQKI